MISRFTNIKGIGRFQDCQMGGRHFNKNTIIFGQNTDGKSTLTDILWSFKTGDNSILEGRRTFGFQGNLLVEFFDEENHPHRFPSTDWNNGFENIEIFDTRFINDNIFEGNEITFGHQKNLHSIIIGPEGKELATKINSLQEEISELTTKKTTKTTEFNRTFKKEILVQDFEKLPRIENLDEKIREIQTTIEISKNQTIIKGTFESIETLLDNIINQDTKTILSKLIETKANLVTEHVLTTWKNPTHSKDFLQTGLDLTKDEQHDCVFCGQELDLRAKDLLTAYSQLFSQEYKKIQSEISSAFSKFEKWNPTNTIESLQDKLAAIKIIFDSTKFIKAELNDIKTSINSEFELKVKDISHKVNFDNYDALIKVFKNVKSQIDELKMKNIFTTEVNIEHLNKKIKEFEFSKIRHTKEWDDFLNEYDEIDEIQETKKQNRERLRKELDDYSSSVFSIHLDTINKTLVELNADFKICDFQPIRRIVGQSERIFALMFFNCHRVAIEETATNKPNFKNTLSESDKRLLAFAFFYSLMVNDDRLNEKIIVFDDPFSSFDFNRRLKTVELLANPHLITQDAELIEKKLNQLIILTHESEFFKWIFKKLDNPKPLRIVSDGITNGVKKSTFIDCDVYKEFIEDRNKKDLKEIKDIYQLNKPIVNYEELCVKCRKVLESIFTRKYFFDLEYEINNRKSVRSFVERLKELSINGFEKIPRYNEFIFLCDNLNIELHQNNMTNEGQNARDVLGDFLRLIKQI